MVGPMHCLYAAAAAYTMDVLLSLGWTWRSLSSKAKLRELHTMSCRLSYMLPNILLPVN